MSSTAITLSFSQRSRDNRRSRTVRLAIIVDDEEDESIRSRVPDILKLKQVPRIYLKCRSLPTSPLDLHPFGIGPKSNSTGCAISYVLDEEALFFSLAHFFDPRTGAFESRQAVLRRRIQMEAV
jgi:hypothetical protein